MRVRLLPAKNRTYLIDGFEGDRPRDVESVAEAAFRGLPVLSPSPGTRARADPPQSGGSRTEDGAKRRPQCPVCRPVLCDGAYPSQGALLDPVRENPHTPHRLE